MKRLLGVLTFFAVVLSGCDKDTDKPVAPSAERVSSAERVGALDGAAGVESVVPSDASAVAAVDSASAAVDGAEVAPPVALDGASAAVAALDSASASASASAAVAVDSAVMVDGAEVGSAVALAGASVAAAKVATDESLTPEEARAELESNGIAFTGAAFLSAAWSGHLATVKLFVQAGMSLETVDDDLGWTALHKAAYASRLEVVKYLVGAGANIEARDEDGYTVLMNAAGIANNVSVVRFLVESGADVFAVGSDGKTARSLAVTVGNTAVADYLNSLENAGEFVQAAADGDLIRVRLFVEWGIDKEDKALVNVGGNSRERTALHAAARNGHLEIVQYLVGQGASVSSTDAAGATPLHAAVESGNLEIVRLLVSKGASVNAKDSSGETPLHYAASYGNKAIATHLVDNGGDLTIASSDGTTPAQVADLSGHTEVETYLESKTPRPDLVVQSPSVDNSTPGPGESLTVSATVRNSGTGSSASTTLRYYQSSDATITTGDTEVGTADAIGELAASATSAQSLSLTAPSSAGTYYYGACVASVSGESDTNNNCSAGVSVTVTLSPEQQARAALDSRGIAYTAGAFIDSARSGNLAVVKLFVQAGMSVETREDDYNRTALHWAAHGGRLEVVKYLVGQGASLTVTGTAYSRTPLHLAARWGHLETVKYLVGAGANVNATDTNGRTPWGLARHHGQTAVVEYLGPKTALADLVVSASVDNSTPTAGQSLTLSATVRNQGTGSSASTTLHYYRSTDATITTGDTEVGSSDAVGALAASASSAQSSSVTAPSSAGTYYYGACVAAVTGESNTTNNCSAGVQVTVRTKAEAARAELTRRGISYTAEAFIAAARDGNLAVVKLFVQAGWSVKTAATNGSTVLHYAAWKGHLSVVQYLVGQGANVNAMNNVGWTPMNDARSAGHTAVVTYLESVGGIAYTAEAFIAAARDGNLAVVKLFVQAGWSVETADTNSSTVLHYAAWKGHLAVVQYLVGQGANVLTENNVGWTAWDDARSAGHTGVVTYLETVFRAELTGRGIAYTANAFVDSASAGNLAVVKLFVQAGMDIDATDRNSTTALFQASVEDHLAVVQYLAEQGADVNFNTPGMSTPLHHAASRGHLEVVKYLVGQGARLTATDHVGWTPLHHAAYSVGHLEVVKYLVEQGADITAETNAGYTPRLLTERLSISSYMESAARAELERLGFSYTGAAFRAEARAGNLAGVKLFVESGMSVEIRERPTSWRPLHFAAYYGHLDVVIHLVRAGADITAYVFRANEYWSPQTWARSCAGNHKFAAERRENCRSVVNYFDSLDDDDE